MIKKKFFHSIVTDQVKYPTYISVETRTILKRVGLVIEFRNLL
jgi:hypothetical protein